MKVNYLFLLFLLLILSLSAVSATDNITADNNLEVSSDIDYDTRQELLQSDMTSGYVTNNQNMSVNIKSINIENYKLNANDLVKYYKNDSQFEVKLTDYNNAPINGVNISLKVNGKEYIKTTNELGVGKLKINLAPGNYVITASYKDKSVTNTIKILSRTYSKDISSTYGKESKFNVKLLDKNGNPMVNELIKFSIGSKSYKAYTNSNGVATLKLNYNAGSYVIKYTADGISGKNKYKVKNYYKLSVYKWGYGADVTKNKNIKKNIPDSELVKKVVKGAKSGTPLIKFQGGKGKIVFITSGVHGSELSSQIAALQLIKYLENHPIKGTVYIMPFMNPKATSKNIRNYGVNLNSKANVKGTMSYKTVKLIVKFKCNAYGDFHCTKPGGKPGKNVAMGSYLPTAKSATLAKYISKNSKVKFLIYKKAGTEYPGALEDMVNLKHIPAVTCEVITPHGTIASGTVSKSLSMMKSLLKFNSII